MNQKVQEETDCEYKPKKTNLDSEDIFKEI